MGTVKNRFVNLINFSAEPDADLLTRSYLIEKLKPNKDDSYNARRLEKKFLAMEPKLVRPDLGVASYRRFMGGLQGEIYTVRASLHALRNLDTWTYAFASEINYSHGQPLRIKHLVNCYLFGQIDVHRSVEDNLQKLDYDGAALSDAVLAYKPVVCAAMQAYLEPQGLALLHDIKGKSEYGKYAKRCDEDLNYAKSEHVARVIAESYFWEKLRPGETLQWNMKHLVTKRKHLLGPTLQRNHHVVEQVYEEISQSARVAQDLNLKSLVLNLDYGLEYVGENYGAWPPTVVGLQVQLPVMASYQNNGQYSNTQAANGLMAAVLVLCVLAAV